MESETSYTASKHAIIGMTKCLAVEWAPAIRVNALAPGYAETAFTEGFRENESIYADILDSIPHTGLPTQRRSRVPPCF